VANGDSKESAELAKRIKADLGNKPEGPLKCTWDLSKVSEQKGKSPHLVRPLKPEPKILETILDHIGNTPLVRINNITKKEGIECEVLAKCEFFNAGGSVKDRIGKRMVEDAEKSGRIKPGDILIEPTSGNTGIGLALAAALKGYRMIITLPEKMSQEKVDVLKALGAEIIRTPTEAAFDSPDSHIGVAKRLNKELQNSHILDQYSNPSNPLAHYDGTAEEILQSCDDKVDVVVMSAGTGGTVTGIARKIKERCPKCKIIGVDPVGSILALPDSLNGTISSYKVEGIGYDFIPAVLDRGLVDEWIKTVDKESFTMARRLIKEEGLLCGGSSGATMHAAIQVAKTMKKGQRLVVILADSVRNYMSKFLNDKWMVDNGFMEEDSKSSHNGQWWSSKAVSELKLETPLTVQPTLPIGECIEILKKQAIDQLPVVSSDGEILGVVTLGNLTSLMVQGRATSTDPVSKAIYRQFKQIDPKTPLSTVSRIFDSDHFALVVSSQKCFTSLTEYTEKKVVFGLVTRIDLLNYIVGNKPTTSTASTTTPSK
jgi:cystathionine beta-synthase